MRQPIVFIGGIHGVGKTSVSKSLVGLLPATHVTAGALIRESAGAGATMTIGAGKKAVPNVDANQALLLQGLELFRTRLGTSASLVLLDGHFSLIDGAGQVVAIPLEVFSAIAPIAVILVEASGLTVRERLIARDAEAPPLDTIAALATRERQRATEVCTALRIPFWALSGDVPSEQAARIAVNHLRSLLGGDA
jgi:adenylate kinase